MRKRVLIVEDDPELQDLYEAMLEGLDCDLVAAFDTVQARQRLDEAVPDIVILDILLGEVHGDVLFREMRQDPRTKDVPVVVVSVLEADRCRAMLGTDSRTFFLRKPFRRVQLLKALQRGLGMSAEEMEAIQ